MYRNQFDKDGKCSVEGNNAENAFLKILKNKGKVRVATLGEQRKHIDFILTTKEREITYDVKARKRVSRNDDETADDLIWVEWMNVGGSDGWLNSKCDFIVFEQAKSFIVVDRQKLKEHCEKLCDISTIVKSSSQALYRCYQRFGRKDLISLIKTSDILPIAEEVIKKS